VLEATAETLPLPPPQQPQEDAATALQRRLAELDRAAQLQAETLANMQLDKPQPKPEEPQFSERDLQWLGARPGIEKDPTVGPTANALAYAFGNGTDEFYRAMDVRFPIDHYRRIESKQDEVPAMPPRAASETEAPPTEWRVVTSAPVSRGVPSDSYVPSPGKVHLSKDEMDIAAASNMTPVEYAREKLKLEALKKQGHYNEQW
jgi:hypothetical protein